MELEEKIRWLDTEDDGKHRTKFDRSKIEKLKSQRKNVERMHGPTAIH